MSLPLAHGIGGVRDLPVPAWLFFYGGALVLALSFVALGALWREPRLERAGERPLRVTGGPVARFVAGLIGFGLFVLVTAAALVGEDVAAVNLAPTFVYVAFWVGAPLLVVLVGDVWPWLSPWRAAADASARLFPGWRAAFEYPDWLGRLPAAVLLFAFVTLELAYTDAARPRAIGIAILVYSWITWLGMMAFGRDAWTRGGEAFAVYFELLARISPLAWRDGRLVARAPLTGVARSDYVPGTLAFVSVMLGSVAFDGFSRTTWWRKWVFELQVDHPGRLGDQLTLLAGIGGIAAGAVLVAATYLAAMRVAERIAGRPLAYELLPSLIPIAFAYVVAHYFSLLVLQGQFLAPLASDPFGWDWDLFGTADVKPDLRILEPRTIWYVQIGALVIGHVAGLTVAHDRVIALVQPARRALRSQYAVLALMVLYTVGGMWILSRP